MPKWREHLRLKLVETLVCEDKDPGVHTIFPDSAIPLRAANFGPISPSWCFIPSHKENRWNLAGGQATGAQNSPLQIRARCPAAHLSVPAEILRAQGSYNNQPFGPFFSWSFKAGTPKLCNFAVLLVKNGYRYLVSLFELVLFTIVLEKEFTVASLVNCFVASIVPELKTLIYSNFVGRYLLYSVQFALIQIHSNPVFCR